MTTEYILQQLAGKVAAVRKAQRDYYGYKGDPRTDKIKQAYLQESQRREQDLDRFMMQLPMMAPSLFPQGWYVEKINAR